ncbi:ankyrin repeat domain-containing protein [Flavimaricola marinus]|uniref:Ankyrin repeats (3 copies) n=1 Tax=Flavimaricola marinus TaxID=1819565 RepID=A0A238LA90_9RHOB|nr:ankyrin repeat domain-containing protein [Flavimaricola marinus]SMY06599.1 Ankyrin repeats (3 copies) [Flavimaricola marinus]
MDIEKQPHVDFFYLVHDSMTEGDIAMLELIATENPPFPLGLDDLLSRQWLTNAIHTCNLDTIAWVLSKGPDVNYQDGEGYIPLKSALEVETESLPLKVNKSDLTIAIIDLLLAAGARINQRMTLDETVLHAAVFRSSPKVIAHLLACGADPHAEDAEHISGKPIDLVRYARAPKEVEALLKEAMRRR